MSEEQKPGDEKVKFPKPKSPNFEERYANNVFFESSYWDLKLVFGILDQSAKPHPTNIHTTVNIPWVQAKMCAYVMLVNVLMQERFNAEAIRVPSGLIPTPLENALPELAATPDGAELVRVLKTIHEALFGKQPTSAEETPTAE